MDLVDDVPFVFLFPEVVVVVEGEGGGGSEAAGDGDQRRRHVASQGREMGFGVGGRGGLGGAGRLEARDETGYSKLETSRHLFFSMTPLVQSQRSNLLLWW